MGGEEGGGSSGTYHNGDDFVLLQPHHAQREKFPPGCKVLICQYPNHNTGQTEKWGGLPPTSIASVLCGVVQQVGINYTKEIAHRKTLYRVAVQEYGLDSLDARCSQRRRKDNSKLKIRTFGEENLVFARGESVCFTKANHQGSQQQQKQKHGVVIASEQEHHTRKNLTTASTTFYSIQAVSRGDARVKIYHGVHSQQVSYRFHHNSSPAQATASNQKQHQQQTQNIHNRDAEAREEILPTKIGDGGGGDLTRGKLRVELSESDEDSDNDDDAEVDNNVEEAEVSYESEGENSEDGEESNLHLTMPAGKIKNSSKNVIVLDDDSESSGSQIEYEEAGRRGEDRGESSVVHKQSTERKVDDNNSWVASATSSSSDRRRHHHPTTVSVVSDRGTYSTAPAAFSCVSPSTRKTTMPLALAPTLQSHTTDAATASNTQLRKNNRKKTCPRGGNHSKDKVNDISPRAPDKWGDRAGWRQTGEAIVTNHHHHSSREERRKFSYNNSSSYDESSQLPADRISRKVSGEVTKVAGNNSNLARRQQNNRVPSHHHHQHQQATTTSIMTSRKDSIPRKRRSSSSILNNPTTLFRSINSNCYDNQRSRNSAADVEAGRRSSTTRDPWRKTITDYNNMITPPKAGTGSPSLSHWDRISKKPQTMWKRGGQQQQQQHQQQQSSRSAFDQRSQTTSSVQIYDERATVDTPQDRRTQKHLEKTRDIDSRPSKKSKLNSSNTAATKTMVTLKLQLPANFTKTKLLTEQIMGGGDGNVLPGEMRYNSSYGCSLGLDGKAINGSYSGRDLLVLTLEGADKEQLVRSSKALVSTLQQALPPYLHRYLLCELARVNKNSHAWLPKSTKGIVHTADPLLSQSCRKPQEQEQQQQQHKAIVNCRNGESNSEFMKNATAFQDHLQHSEFSSCNAHLVHSDPVFPEMTPHMVLCSPSFEEVFRCREMWYGRSKTHAGRNCSHQPLGNN